MKITNLRDYETVLKINKEYTNDVTDVVVIVYKMYIQKVKTNSYGESPKKTWMRGVLIPGILRVYPENVENDVETINTTQRIQIGFLRDELRDRQILPESGDIIEFDSQYYEIDNTNDINFWAGRVEYNHSLLCQAHLTRVSN